MPRSNPVLREFTIVDETNFNESIEHFTRYFRGNQSLLKKVCELLARSGCLIQGTKDDGARHIRWDRIRNVIRNPSGRHRARPHAALTCSHLLLQVDRSGLRWEHDINRRIHIKMNANTQLFLDPLLQLVREIRVVLQEIA